MTSLPSAFCKVELAPKVPVFKLSADYQKDSNPQKINLGVGAYRDANGDPWVLPVVRSVEAQMVNDPALNHEYLPISGLPAFCEAATKLCLGADSPAIAENRAGGVQALSGTGSLRIAAEFLKRFYKTHVPNVVVSYPDPTWANHDSIFRYAGFQDRRKYRYWDEKNRCLDLAGMKEDLMSYPEYSIVILHACAHNPTGIDPTHEQWMEIADVCKEKKHFPVFDSAYQGFASGDPDLDAWSIRYFVDLGFEFFVCQSFAKNFGLYNERVGNLTMVMRNPSALTNVRSQLEIIIRGMYSNPPNHGARVVAMALNNPSYRLEWLDNIRTMSDRIKRMRKCLFEKLKIRGTPGNWDHIVKQIGMFSYTGLTQVQSEYMVKQKHVYMLKSGRISMAGLNDGNIDYFTDALHEAVMMVSENKL